MAGQAAGGLGRAAKKPVLTSKDLTARNVHDLARVMVTEAGGSPGESAQIAVGWCLKNRMIRNGTDNVERVWSPAFQHRKAATAMALHDAAGILAGTIADPTAGATHFYTPSIMPKEGESTEGIDVSGGLESVPGVTDGQGKPVKNYAPGFSLTFTPKPIAGVPERTFKFYQQPGSGYVR
jgi:hypothetical protein